MTDGNNRRGPKPQEWYEEWIRHALLKFTNTRALAANELCKHPQVQAVADSLPHDQWQPEVRALRQLLKKYAKRVVELADDCDRQWMEKLLNGLMRGDTMAAIAHDIGYQRETVQRNYWPQAVRAIATTFIRSARQAA